MKAVANNNNPPAVAAVAVIKTATIMIETCSYNNDNDSNLPVQATMREPEPELEKSLSALSLQLPMMTTMIMKSIPSNTSLESLETLTTDSSSDSSSDTDESFASRLDVEDENDTCNDVKQPQRPTSRLSWGTVQIREYSRTIGDHPDVRYGPPLSLDWDYNEHSPKELDDYEENRGPKKRSLRMTSLTRRNLLHNVFMIPEEELDQAEKRAQKNQKKRQQSNRQGYFSARAEDRVRRFKRRFSREVIFNALSAASGPFMGMNGMMSSSMSMNMQA